MRRLGSVVLGLTVLGQIGVPAAPVSAAPTTRTFVVIHSDALEDIDGGLDRLFLPSLGSITVSGGRRRATIELRGGTGGSDDRFTLAFVAPPGERLRIRSYLHVHMAPDASPSLPAMSIYANGRSCSESTGRFDVKDFDTDSSGRITRLWMVFEERCLNSTASLFGEVMYRMPLMASSFTTAPTYVWFPDVYVGGHRTSEASIDVLGGSSSSTIADVEVTGPHASDYALIADACTGGLLADGDRCRVDVLFTPSLAGPRTAALVVRDAAGFARRIRLDGTGIGGTTTVALTSEPGDWVGAGGTYDYDPSNADIVVRGDDHHIHGWIDHTQDGAWWFYDFAPPEGEVLAPGVTFDAITYPLHEPSAGMSVSGPGRGCPSTGSFTIHDVSFGPTDRVDHLFLEFEQRCEGSDAALRGVIRYRIPGPDAEGPAPPTGLLVERSASGLAARVTWASPSDSDFAFVVARFSISGFAPRRPASQRHGYVGPGTSVLLRGLDPERPASVSVFPVDALGNVGTAVKATA